MRVNCSQHSPAIQSIKLEDSSELGIRLYYIDMRPTHVGTSSWFHQAEAYSKTIRLNTPLNASLGISATMGQVNEAQAQEVAVARHRRRALVVLITIIKVSHTRPRARLSAILSIVLDCRISAKLKALTRHTPDPPHRRRTVKVINLYFLRL